MITAFYGGHQLNVEFSTFAGGERNVRIKGYTANSPLLRSLEEGLTWDKELFILAHIDSSDAAMDLLLFTDAFNRLYGGAGSSIKKVCHLPYIPYARQDRVMVDGEPLSSVLFGKLINMCKFDRVIVNDPHSDVAPSHIDNVSIEEQHETALRVLGERFFDGAVIVAPDAGAIKKATKLAKKVAHDHVGVGTKHRDLSTNNITATSYTGPDVAGKRVIMVDDICDGGRTFIELGKVLRSLGASEVILYTTHGIYSYGTDVFAGVVDEVYSSYPWVKNIARSNESNIFKFVAGTVNFK